MSSKKGTVPYLEFFVDSTFSPDLAEILEKFDQYSKFIHHDNKFDEGTPDPEWIRDVDTWNPRPVVITGDLRITRSPANQEALRQTGLTIVCFARGWMNLKWDDQVWQVVRAWPNIRKCCTPSKPSVFVQNKGNRPPVTLCETDQVGLKAK